METNELQVVADSILDVFGGDSYIVEELRLLRCAVERLCQFLEAQRNGDGHRGMSSLVWPWKAEPHRRGVNELRRRMGGDG